MAELEHGAAIGGHRIQELIGQGSTGTVYVAEDIALRRRVALKLLLPELAHDERFRERFLRESRMAAALEHPHIVPIHAVGESDGVLILAMRYVDNRDLAGLIARAERLQPARALNICRQVASALDAAHAHDLIHRDVKPGNILLAEEADGDYAYLCDFGLAKHGSAATSLTGARDIVGTVGYLSPEQIDGLPVDGRTDVYALGCVLFECLAGAPPFVRENELATILAHRADPAPSITELRPELPTALDLVIARALAKDRATRYATCTELVNDAGRALAGRSLAPAPAAPALHTFVFADIRGYTAYMREHGDEVGAELARRFAAIVEEVAPAHGGTPPRLRGDEALVSFDSARAALRYAIELQRRVAEDGLPRGVGIGLDAGEVVGAEQDMHGGALNRAARLCARAKAGEVLATDGVLHLAGHMDDVRPGLRRLERLKGFAQPVGVNEMHAAAVRPRHERRRRLARAVRGTRPRVRLAVAAALLAAVGLALVALGAFDQGGRPSAPPFEANSIALVNARTGAPAGTVAPGLHICVFETAGSELWACDADQSIVLRVDARARRVVDQVPLPTYHGSFTIGFGSIWEGDISSPTVRRVSARYRSSSPPIRLPGVPMKPVNGIPQLVGDMLTTRDAVWATYGFPKRIARIDPETNKVTFSAPLRQNCPCDAWLAESGGRLWAIGGDGRHVYRLNPRSGRTVATGRLHQGQVAGAVVAGGYLWVAITEDGGVWKIDDSGSSIDKVATGRGPASVDAADGYVWVANADDGTVTRIDARTNATRRYRVGHRPLAVAELGGTIFVGLGESAAEAAAGIDGPKVVRGLAPDFGWASDPVQLSSWGDLSIGSASGAGLMAARTDARGATTIEPEIAARAPTVSGDGRTYTFELRPGLRFSSNEPVTADAVRSSIERAVAPDLINGYCRELVLADVAGQDAYEAGRADRIAGIRISGNRISITLTRPSRTLPVRLANPCLSVVPPGTPTIPPGLSHPIPSAGPYYTDSWVRGQQLVLRRNPHYGGPRPQPLDALIVGGGIGAAEAARRVESGAADFATDLDTPPAPDFAPGGRYEREFGGDGGRLRYERPPSGYTVMVLFNTRRGVFRSPQLRRAANLAIDRTALTQHYGGEPRSLLIPPGVPGYRSAQAYPLEPDLRRARALARGRGGTAVLAVPAGIPELPQVAGLVRRDLARIGVHVRVRALADPAAVAADPGQRIDALVAGRGPDYPDPFSAVNVILEPGARVPGFPDFFDASRWVRRMRAAAAAPPERRDAVYARLDADLARGPAPFAVLRGQPGTPQLLSRRLGCERFPHGRLDLSSLCVR